MNFIMQPMKNVIGFQAVCNIRSLCKSMSAHCLSYRNAWACHTNGLLNPVLRSSFKYNISHQADEEDTTLTISQQIDVLSELNQASLSTLQKYGLDISTASALHECRPILQFTQLESFPGIGREMLPKIYEKYSQASPLSMQPLRPSLSVLVPPKSIVAVTPTKGCICYCHLSLSDLTTTSSADDETPVVELLGIDLLPIETSNSKLHPHKLLMKVEEVLSTVPSADLYVMPNAQYDNYQQKSSAEDINVRKQLAQITGMVQGHLAMAPSAHSPPLYHLKDSFVYSLFGLKVYRNAVTSSLSLLHRLLQGVQVETTSLVRVPRLVVPGGLYERCVKQTQDFKHTVAPTLYTSVAFSALLHRALRSTPS